MYRNAIIERAIEIVSNEINEPSCCAIDSAAIEYTGEIDDALLWDYRLISNARGGRSGFEDIPEFAKLTFADQKRIRIERLTAFLETLED